METYSYSIDEESYEGEFDTRDEAIKEAFATYPDADTVYTGLNQHYEPDYEYAAKAALESLEVEAYDQCGEHAEGWDIAYNKTIIECISQAIKEAVEELDKPLFYTVTEVIQDWREGCGPY